MIVFDKNHPQPPTAHPPGDHPFDRPAAIVDSCGWPQPRR
jgi:hypothetical protein